MSSLGVICTMNDNINVIMCEVFSQMSNNEFLNYKKCMSSIHQICKTTSWDLLDHDEDDNATFIHLYQLIPQYAISTIIYQALAVEAFVNYYGMAKLGEQYLNTIDRKTHGSDTECGTTRKLKRILQDLNITFLDDDKLFRDITNLFRVRDKLVHYKTKPISIESIMHDPESKTNEDEQILFVLDDIENRVNIYSNLKRQISQLDGTYVDFIDSENMNMESIMNKQIIDIFNKSLGDLGPI